MMSDFALDAERREGLSARRASIARVRRFADS